MVTEPFAAWPSFTEEEAEAARAVLLSNKVNYWTGEEGRSFEREFAAWTGTRHAVALANGSVALDAIWKALEIRTGDEVVVTPRTFVACASSIVSAGAIPVFADVDRDSQLITPATVERVMSPRTRAILAVHLAGWPCEMDGLVDLAASRKALVVEDCAQSHGARYKGRSVGGLGNIATWSFCQDKIITTAGEGGMITTDDASLADRVWSSKDHGKSRGAVIDQGRGSGSAYRWVHDSIGTNWRLTEIQSAIGRIQLKRVGDWHATRTNNANRILAAASAAGVFRAPTPPPYIEHAWYRCYLFVELERLKASWNRDRILRELNDLGVPCGGGACPEIYRERAFIDAGLVPAERLPVAAELGETSISLLVHPTLTEEHLTRTTEALLSIGRAAAR